MSQESQRVFIARLAPLLMRPRQRLADFVPLATLGTVVCNHCSVGSYQKVSGQTSCVSCNVGFFVPSIGRGGTSDEKVYDERGRYQMVGVTYHVSAVPAEVVVA